MLELPLWMLVKEGLFSMHELETSASMDDVARATALLEMKGDVDAAVLKGVMPRGSS